MNYLVTMNIERDVVHPNSRASFLHAARRWGAQYVEITAPIAPAVRDDLGEEGYQKAWAEKVYLDWHLPDGRFCYVDADTVIRSDCPSPFEIVPEGTWAWAPNNITGHECTAETVLRDFADWRDRIMKPLGYDLADLDIARQYCNTGVMIFDLPEHRRVFDTAREIIDQTGMDADRWVVSDQAPLCAAVHLNRVAVQYLSGDYHHFGVRLWNNWPRDMHAGIYHFCGDDERWDKIGGVQWDLDRGN